MPKRKIKPVDIEKVRQILDAIPEDRHSIGEDLYNKLCFLDEILTDLRTQIKEKGTTSLFKQGKQEFVRESPALKAYNNTIQRYVLVYSKFIELLPKQAEPVESDQFLDFCNEGFNMPLPPGKDAKRGNSGQ